MKLVFEHKMQESKVKICHITTVHPRNDIRIFYKECLSLTSLFEVYLIVADGKGDCIQDKVHILDVYDRKRSRFGRMLLNTRRAYIKALELNSDIYHFHDPEFMFFGLKLKRKGKNVIYDVHEDLPKQVLSKSYISLLIRKILSKIIFVIEGYISARLSAIITVTPGINERFSKYNFNSRVINNYPRFEEFDSTNNFTSKQNEVCYVGSITQIRGIEELIDSIENIPISLNLAGKFESDSFKAKLKNKPGWGKVNYYGIISPKEVYEIMLRSIAGVSTLYPEPNYLTSQATKIYEYMYAGIPVIASDFPLWKEFIEKYKCGICVDPKNIQKISEAINFLKDNPEIARTMGENGRKAAIEEFSWKNEEKELFNIYLRILKKN